MLVSDVPVCRKKRGELKFSLLLQIVSCFARSPGGQKMALYCAKLLSPEGLVSQAAFVRFRFDFTDTAKMLKPRPGGEIEATVVNLPLTCPLSMDH